jgi:hypothetical protein
VAAPKLSARDRTVYLRWPEISRWHEEDRERNSISGD